MGDPRDTTGDPVVHPESPSPTNPRPSPISPSPNPISLSLTGPSTIIPSGNLKVRSDVFLYRLV